jgi:hypothetical protein
VAVATISPRTSSVRLATKTVEGHWLSPCVYCGMTATARDHFVPRSWRRMMDGAVWRVGVWLDAPDTVPVCAECNLTAGAVPFDTVAEKRRYIQECYRRKYGRLLARSFWSDQELDELGHTLRSTVERSETQKLRLILRLAWPYEFGDEVGAFVRYLVRGGDHVAALNEIRRKEILAR